MKNIKNSTIELCMDPTVKIPSPKDLETAGNNNVDSGNTKSNYVETHILIIIFNTTTHIRALLMFSNNCSYKY